MTTSIQEAKDNIAKAENLLRTAQADLEKAQNPHSENIDYIKRELCGASRVGSVSYDERDDSYEIEILPIGGSGEIWSHESLTSVFAKFPFKGFRKHPNEDAVVFYVRTSL